MLLIKIILDDLLVNNYIKIYSMLLEKQVIENIIFRSFIFSFSEGNIETISETSNNY